MVSTLSRNSKSTEVVNPKVDTAPKEVEVKEETEPSEPINWLYKNTVSVKNLPLTPEILDGEVHYETKQGNITILDPRYAAYRVGSLLSDLGFTSEDIGSEDLKNFIEDAINYYLVDYPKEKAAIEAERLGGKRDQVLQSSIRQFKKMSAILGLGRENWTDEQWIDFISRQP